MILPPTMLSTSLYAILSAIGISLLSLLGIIFFLVEETLIRKSLLYFVSFSTGALFGDVFLHILPDLAEGKGLTIRVMLFLLSGILFSFAVEKVIRWRHCHTLPESEPEQGHHHHPVGIMSALGESVHNFIDGVVIGASYLVSVPLGVATTLAIIFHEIPHEIGNVAVLLHSGFPRRKALLINLLSASAAIVGTVGVLLASRAFTSVTDFLLPFAGGNLLYIAASDLIPELHKQTGLRQGAIQLLLMVGGMASMYLIRYLE